MLRLLGLVAHRGWHGEAIKADVRHSASFTFVESRIANMEVTYDGREPKPPTPEENKAVIRRFVEEVQNEKSEGVYDELNDPEFVNLSSPPESRVIAKAGRSSSSDS